MVAANDAVSPALKTKTDGNARRLMGRAVSPVTSPTNWQLVNTAPGTGNGTGGASTIVSRIDTLLTAGGAAVTPIKMDGVGTSVKVSMVYDSGLTLTSGPVIMILGIDEYGAGEFLADANGATSWTLTANSALDSGGVSTGDLAMVAAERLLNVTAQPIVDALNYDRVAVVVYTAAVGNGYTTGRIVAKVI